MTRFVRAIRSSRSVVILLAAPIALLVATGNALADDAPALAVPAPPAAASQPVADSATTNIVDLTKQNTESAADAGVADDTVTGGAADVPSSAANAIADLSGVQLLPSVERPLHHLYCVEYARLRSGLQIFGDAKTWWEQAEKAYARLSQPVSDAVMVFAGSKRIRRGHVAVVTQIISAREIRVDHANWQNEGEIEKSAPVLDVSPGNDWSQVRVWDMASGQFGVHVYAIKGFVARVPGQQAGL